MYEGDTGGFDFNRSLARARAREGRPGQPVPVPRAVCGTPPEGRTVAGKHSARVNTMSAKRFVSRLVRGQGTVPCSVPVEPTTSVIAFRPRLSAPLSWPPSSVAFSSVSIVARVVAVVNCIPIAGLGDFERLAPTPAGLAGGRDRTDAER